VGATTATLRWLEPDYALAADCEMPVEVAPYYVPIENPDEVAQLEAFSASQDRAGET
jgi:hypothetical protein